MFHKLFITASALVAALMFGSPAVWAQSGQEQAPAMGGSTEERRSGTQGQSEAQQQGLGSESHRQDQAGMDQEGIKKVQEALKDKGHDPGPVDGIFGPQTRQALKQFQSAQGLEATGELNDKTKEQLGVEQSGGLFQNEPKSESSKGQAGEAQQQQKPRGSEQ